MLGGIYSRNDQKGAISHNSAISYNNSKVIIPSLVQTILSAVLSLAILSAINYKYIVDLIQDRAPTLEPFSYSFNNVIYLFFEETSFIPRDVSIALFSASVSILIFIFLRQLTIRIIKLKINQQLFSPKLIAPVVFSAISYYLSLVGFLVILLTLILLTASNIANQYTDMFVDGLSYITNNSTRGFRGIFASTVLTLISLLTIEVTFRIIVRYYRIYFNKLLPRIDQPIVSEATNAIYHHQSVFSSGKSSESHISSQSPAVRPFLGYDKEGSNYNRPISSSISPVVGNSLRSVKSAVIVVVLVAVFTMFIATQTSKYLKKSDVINQVTKNIKRNLSNHKDPVLPPQPVVEIDRSPEAQCEKQDDIPKSACMYLVGLEESGVDETVQSLEGTGQVKVGDTINIDINDFALTESKTSGIVNGTINNPDRFFYGEYRLNVSSVGDKWKLDSIIGVSPDM